MTLTELAEKGSNVDLVREMIRHVAQRMMDTGVVYEVCLIRSFDSDTIGEARRQKERVSAADLQGDAGRHRATDVREARADLRYRQSFLDPPRRGSCSIVRSDDNRSGALLDLVNSLTRRQRDWGTYLSSSQSPGGSARGFGFRRAQGIVVLRLSDDATQHAAGVLQHRHDLSVAMM